MSHSDHSMWRKPQHHLDVDNANDHVHWVELFYDLIHVVAVFMLGNYLSHHLSIDGFLLFLMMFMAVWISWGDTSAFNSLYVSTDVVHRIIMAFQICSIMFYVAAIPSVSGKGWVYFATAYAVNRAITAYMFYRAIKVGAEQTGMAYEVARNFFVLAIIFAISAWLPKPYNIVLFVLGLISIPLLYMVPKVGMMRFERSVLRMGHMAERFALLLLIVVGEGFFKLVVTLAEKGIYKVSPDVLINVVLGGICLFVLCWIYFDFVGNAKPKNNNKWVLSQWWLSHPLLMLSAVMIGVAMTGEIKVDFWGSYPLGYAWLGCSGLVLYIIALMMIQSSVEERPVHRFGTTGVRLFGIGLSLLTLSLVHYVPTIVGNFLWCTALLSQIAVPVSRSYKEFVLDKAEE